MKRKDEPIPFTALTLRLLAAELFLLQSYQTINEWKTRPETLEKIKRLTYLEEARFQREVVFRKQQLRQAPRDAARPTKRQRLRGLPDPVPPPLKRPGRPRKIKENDNG